MTAPCGAGWRVESCALGSGAIQASLPVVSFDAQNLLSGIGTGTFTIHPQDVKNLRHIWPRMTSLWVTYYDEFVWAGMINGLSLQNGAISLGCNSIEDYLNHRNIRRTLTYTGVDQNRIAAQLVEYARKNLGINLRGAYIPSSQSRDRTYDGVARLNLGEQISALTDISNGPEWRLSATRANGRWTATMTFADSWGENLETTIVSDVQAPDYGLEVNTDSLANVVDAMASFTPESTDDGTGSGTSPEAVNLLATAMQLPYPYGDSPYVEYDAALTFQDVTEVSTLQQYADGHLATNKEPYITPRAVLFGREATQGLGIQLGDRVDARLCISGIRYEGLSRVIGETWRASPDSATARELMLSPNGAPSQTLFDKEPCSSCPDCD